MSEYSEITENDLEQQPVEEKNKFLWWHHLVFFGLGYLAMNGLVIILREFSFFSSPTNTPEGFLSATLLNILVYLLTFSALAGILFYVKSFSTLFKGFTKLRPYIKGLFYGFIVIIASVSYSSLVTIILGPSDSNINQLSIEAMIKEMPVLNFFWIVILGPVVEELLYRVGIFDAFKKVNKLPRVFAYVISGLIFGFIHFNLPLTDSGAVDQAKLIVELINIPSYIISGLLFAYIYDKEGFTTSAVAHITNNLLSFIVTIINAYRG